MITGAANISLTKESRDRDSIAELPIVPDGARVVVNVGTRTTIPATTLHQLTRHASRLHLDVHGSPAAVQAWVTALRGAA